LELAVTYDEGVGVEKLELETSSCFGVSCAGLWVWCSSLRLVVWAGVNHSWGELGGRMSYMIFESSSCSTIEVPSVDVVMTTMCML